jgi:transmembrane sensor
MTDDREQPDLDARWEAIARYLAGESTPEEEQRVREALAGDAERAALLNALDSALARPDETPLSEREVNAALASVMARRDLPADHAPRSAPDIVPLRPRPSAQLREPQMTWRSAGLRAAAAVLLVAGASVLWRATRPTDRTLPAGSVAAVASRTYRTTAGQLDTLKLADGSTVVLGPTSRLALGATFGVGGREVSLDGQAYFDVVHDDARPFVVRTSSATLRDIGTTFSVHSDSVRGTRVAVTSGAVDVVATRASSATPTVLHAGDRAEVAENGVRVERGVVREGEPSWTRGVLELRDAPLAVVQEELRRWYGVELVVTDPAIASRRLTATFDRAAADDLGRVLAAVLGGSVTRTGDTLRLGASGAR